MFILMRKSILLGEVGVVAVGVMVLAVMGVMGFAFCFS